MLKDKLHDIVDALPESKINSAWDFLNYLLEKEQSRNIISVIDNVPEEDKTPDADELKAIAEAEKDIAEGKTRLYGEFKKELGL